MDYPGKVITKNQVTPTQISATGVWTLDDAAAAVKNNNWPVAGVPNPISKSLRFNSADSAYLNRTFGSAPTNDDKATISLWVKRTNPGAENQLYSARASGAAAYTSLRFDSTDELDFLMVNSSSTVIARLVTTAKYRDPSAWYHIVFAYDSTDATSSNRLKLYVNGVQVTVFNTATYPAQNTDLALWAKNTVVNYISREGDGYSSYLNGYLTEINFIDGQALTPSSFGMTDPVTGVWEPLKYSGTYGTNGFYLNFKDATSTTTLGYDYSGNANNWTTNNFSVTAGSGNDSLTDVPTPWIAFNTTGDVGGVVRGNYCTLNPLTKPASATISNGNLDTTLSTTSGSRSVASTFYQDTSSWYWEAVATTVGNNSAGIGIANTSFVVGNEGGTGCYFYLSDGRKVINNTYSSYGASWIANDVIGVAFDATNGTITFYKNGSSQGQITGIPTGVLYTPFVCSNTSVTASVFVTNFGQRPFAYTPPSGFLSLCTTNLPASTILDGDQYFNAVLYTGNGTSQTISTVGFQPDLVWVKNRTTAQNHVLVDVLRGDNDGLFSNLTDAELTDSGFPALTSTGFSVGASSWTNQNGSAFVGWNWKANGAGVSNTAGTITSTVSANTTSGFSIVTYTGNGSTGTVGHGLGVAPSMIIVKDRDDAGTNWCVYHIVLGNGNRVLLNLTNASAATNNWNSTSPTSNVFSVGISSEVNANTKKHVAYCFAAISGFSAFGSYTGNGSADGPFVYLGFRPRYVLIKPSSAADNWQIEDSARNTFNVINTQLFPNLSNAEATSTTRLTDFLSNGFKIRGTNAGVNGNGTTFIYAAFAENPFKNALAR